MQEEENYANTRNVAVSFKILLSNCAIPFVIDFDECLNSGPSECKQICINTPGSFVCDCYKGYRLNIDQSTCDGWCYPIS